MNRQEIEKLKSHANDTGDGPTIDLCDRALAGEAEATALLASRVAEKDEDEQST